MSLFNSRTVLVSFLVLVCFIGFASATLHMEKISMVPDSKTVTPESPVRLGFSITIVPSGGQTFADGHSLQLTTDLLNATWNLTVFVDGIQAAVIPATGSTAFVNGYLLSYPTLRDVYVNVTLTGTTPPGVNSGQDLVQVSELDNAGNPFPGSGFTMPLLYPTTRATTLPLTTNSSVKPGTTPPLTKGAPGFSFPGVLAAVGTGAFFLRYRSRRYRKK